MNKSNEETVAEVLKLIGENPNASGVMYQEISGKIGYNYSIANQRLGLPNLVVCSDRSMPPHMVSTIFQGFHEELKKYGKLEDRMVFKHHEIAGKSFYLYVLKVHPSHLHLFEVGIEVEKLMGLENTGEYYVLAARDQNGKDPWEAGWYEPLPAKVWEERGSVDEENDTTIDVEAVIKEGLPGWRQTVLEGIPDILEALVDMLESRIPTPSRELFGEEPSQMKSTKSFDNQNKTIH